MKKTVIFLFCILLILTGCSSSPVSTKDTPIKDEAFYNSLSNKTQGWGFQRTDEGPRFSTDQIRQMEEYGCIYREGGDEKNIYLTFDEGYENGYTSIILDTLREKGVSAAFFVTAPYVKSNPDLIKRMAKEGHIIGNHTANHPSLPSVKDIDTLQKELFELDRLVYGICGQKCHYLRPPKGEYSERTLALTNDLGYINVFWSQAYVDWNDNVTAQEAYQKITQNLHSGCVLLLHAVSKGNADALKDVIETAQKEGYTFKSLNEYQ